MRLVDYIAVNRNVPISMLHRRRVHDSVGLYDETLPVVGDYAFHLQLLQSVEVGFLDRPLAQWRQRPAAVGASSNSMYTQSGGHRHYDAELRERYFRPWAAEHGIGLPMFLSRNTETVVERSEGRLLEELGSLREEIAQLHERLDGIAPTGSQQKAGPSTAERAADLVRRAGRRALGVGRRVRPPRAED